MFEKYPITTYRRYIRVQEQYRKSSRTICQKFKNSYKRVQEHPYINYNNFFNYAKTES